jgi:hypothetical protein
MQLQAHSSFNLRSIVSDVSKIILSLHMKVIVSGSKRESGTTLETAYETYSNLFNQWSVHSLFT